MFLLLVAGVVLGGLPIMREISDFDPFPTSLSPPVRVCSARIVMPEPAICRYILIYLS